MNIINIKKCSITNSCSFIVFNRLQSISLTNIIYKLLPTAQVASITITLHQLYLYTIIYMDKIYTLKHPTEK